MTDPKTAARTVATRLAESEISIKHLQALDLVAAGCGFQDRSKLKDLAELPVLKRVNRRLLESVATVLARHDLARRTRIVDITSDVLLPKRTIDMSDFRPRGDRIGTVHSKGAIAFMKMEHDAIASVSQGLSRPREGYAHYAPIFDGEILNYVSDRPGLTSAFQDQQDVGGPYVIACTNEQTDDPWTLFWNETDGWGDLASATIMDEQDGDLPTVGMEKSAVRWMSIDDATFRAAVDAAILKMDQDDADMDQDEDALGEQMLDYDRIAAMIALSKVFARPMGPLEIAVRDGAQRASLYVASLSDDADTAGGQVREWVAEVEHAFRQGLGLDQETLRDLLRGGDDAVVGIQQWLDDKERLWAWMKVSEFPDILSNEIDPEGSGVTEGIDMKPLGVAFAGLKPRSLRDPHEKAMNIVRPLMEAKGMLGEPKRRNDGVLAPCPAHDDSNPSLLVSIAPDGKPSVKCLAGCSHDAVMEGIRVVMDGIVTDAVPAVATLDERREAVAQAHFIAHAFGQDVVVAECDGWERTTPGDEWSRTVYLESDQADIDDVSESATYVVRFAPGSDKVASSYAITGNGRLIGDPIDPEHDLTLDLGGMTIALAAVTGQLPLKLSPGIDAIIADVVGKAYHSAWAPFDDGMSKETATRIASAAIEGLRLAKTEGEREKARMDAVSLGNPPRSASETSWDDVRDGAEAIRESIDSALEALVEAGTLEEAPDYDKDEFEQTLMDLAFEKLDAEDTSTWRDAVKGNAVVEIYLHLIPKGDSVEETCLIDHPHLLPENVVVDDQFRFVLSRLGITGKAWNRFARPKNVEPSKRMLHTARSEPLVSVEELGVMIENGAAQDFLVSLYCQAPLTDVLDLDLSKRIAFEKVRLAVLNVMLGTFHDHRLEGIVEMADGVDGLLTTSDCGPYASQTEDLVASAYFSRIGTTESVSRGPAATRELDACLTVEGLRRLRPEERVAWREESPSDGQGGIVLKADVSCQDARNTYGMRSMTAVFADARAERPEIGIGRRW
jgi:hypothetical protein